MLFRRILLVQTGFLGDVILSTSLLQALRTEWPEAFVAAMVRPSAAGLLEGLPCVDQVIPDDRHGAARTNAWVRALRALQHHRFDLALTASRSFRTGTLLRAAGIPTRVAYPVGLNRWFYTHLAERPDGVHVSRRDLALLHPLGLQASWLPPVVAEADRLSSAVEDALQHPGQTTVALAAGSVWPTKRWPAAKFGEVARELLKRGANVLLVGGPGDTEVVAEVTREAPGAVDLCARTPLPEFAALLRRCSVLITNDSAPAHVAAAVGTPVVDIYGPSTAGLGFAPLDPRSRVVELPLDCRPCSKPHAPACPLGHFRCMSDITPAMVLGALDEVLQRASRSEDARLLPLLNTGSGR